MTDERLGKYDIRGTLGRGAMGTVYDGWDPAIARRVAIKTVRLPDPADANAQEELARFKREAQAAGRLNHPNIVGVFDYGETSDVAYIVMEFVDGRTLKAVLDNNERMALPEIARVMNDILAGLQFSHDRGVVHRDIKPANVMITEGGQAKIADFGIARIESSSMTQAGTVLGTPAYMSPEQFMGQVVDLRSDIYSCGVLLYQLLTGERPFDGSMTAIMHKALNTAPPRPSALSVNCPPAFDPVVARAMAKRPEERFASATTFTAAIEAALTAPVAGLPPSSIDDLLASSEATMVARPAATQPVMPERVPGVPAAAATASAARKRGGAGGIIAIVALALVAALGGGAYVIFGGRAGTDVADLRPKPPTSAPPQTSIPLSQPPNTTVASTPNNPPKPTPAPTSPAPAAPGPIAATASVAPTTPTPTPGPVATPLAPVRPPPEKPPVATPVATPVAPPSQALAMNTPPTLTPNPATPTTTTAPVGVPALAPVIPQTTAPIPASPPTPVPVPQAPVRLSPAAIRQAVSSATGSAQCALVTADVNDAATAVTVSGLAGNSGIAALRQAVETSAAGTDVVWQVTGFDGPYCPAVDAIRVVAGRGNGLSAVPNTTRLHNNDLLILQTALSDFPAHLLIDYLDSQGGVTHLVPTTPDVTDHTIADKVYAARSRQRFGDPLPPKYDGLRAAPPPGTDMIVVIASQAPLVVLHKQVEDRPEAYFANLQSAIEDARHHTRIAATAFLLDVAIP